MSMPQSPGWYDDADDPSQLRYFDGVVWTKHTAPRRTQRSAAGETAFASQQQAAAQQAATAQAAAQQAGTQRPGTQPGTQQPGTQRPGTQQPGTQQPAPGQGGQREHWRQPLPPGQQGQPLPPGQQGQPLPPGQQGQPLPPGQQGQQGPPGWGQQQQYQPPANQQQYQQHPQHPQQYQQQGGWQAPAWSHPTGPTTPDGVPLASYWQRVGAFVIDYIIRGTISVLLSLPFLWGYLSDVMDTARQAAANGSSDIFPATPALDFATQIFPVTVIGAVIGFLYQALFLMRFGATPGKLAMGIHVRLRERPGPLSFATVSKRYALDIGLAIIGLLPLLGALTVPTKMLDLLWPLWDSKRQALHDKIAGTNVVIGRRDPR